MWNTMMSGARGMARGAAGGLGSMMTTGMGKRTLGGAAMGAAAGGYMGGLSGALTGGVMGAAGGRYGGAAYSHRGLGSIQAVTSAGGMALREGARAWRGATMRSSGAYNRVASTLKNFGAG